MSKLLAWWSLTLLLVAPAMAAPTWHKVVAPQFTLYSSGKSTDTLKTAEELNQFIAALQGVLPVNPRALPPLTVVLFGRDREFRDYRPTRPNGKPWDVAGFFSRREGWAVFGLSTANLDDEVRQTVYHEAVHWFSSAFDLPNPPWLEEGLAEVFSTFTVEKGNASWGEAIAPHVSVLRSTRPLPLERLLAVSQSDPLFNETLRTGEFYAGSWAFVHYLLFGKHGMPRSVLNDYITMHRRTAMHPDEAFKKAFGSDYREMDRLLGRYLKNGQYFKGTVPVTPSATPLVVEPASDLEREVALTRLAIGAGQSARALTHANNARNLGPDFAAASEALGYAAESADDKATMLTAFTDAVRQGTRDYRIHFVLGNEAHRASTPTMGMSTGPLDGIDSKDARKIVNHYERAINLRPSYRVAYQNLGGIIELAENAGPADRQFLELGLTLFPDDGMIQLGLAVLDRKLGAKEESRRWLDGVLNAASPHPSHVAAYARRIDDAWTHQDARDRISALASESKFAEAMVEIDRLVASGLPARARTDMIMYRRSLDASAKMQAAKEAAENQSWTEVRRLLDEVIASDAPVMAKQAARRWLADVDRRNPRSK
jgi:tetratricopeptide (TPR) repeat protein